MPVKDNVDVSQIDSDPLMDRGVEGTSVSAADSAIPATEPTSSDGAPGTSSAGSGEGGAAVAAPADPNLGAGAVGGGKPGSTTSSPDSWVSIRQAAENALGYRFDPSITNDQQALAHLVAAAQQSQRNDYYAQLGRSLAPQAPAITQYLQQQRSAPQPSEWDKPQWDDRWTSLVKMDAATGLAVAKEPGVPAQIVDGVNKYLGWYKRMQDDPQGYQDHLFQSRYLPQIREAIQQERASIQQETVVGEILRANSDWLYAKAEDGAYVYQANGRPSLSPAGTRYTQILQEVQGAGIRDPRAMDSMAKRLLQGEIAASQIAANSGSQRSTSPQTQQAQQSNNRNTAGTMPPSQRRNNPAAVEPSTTGLTLRDALSSAFKQEGIGDDDIEFGDTE